MGGDAHGRKLVRPMTFGYHAGMTEADHEVHRVSLLGGGLPIR